MVHQECGCGASHLQICTYPWPWGHQTVPTSADLSCGSANALASVRTPLTYKWKQLRHHQGATATGLRCLCGRCSGAVASDGCCGVSDNRQSLTHRHHALHLHYAQQLHQRHGRRAVAAAGRLRERRCGSGAAGASVPTGPSTEGVARDSVGCARQARQAAHPPSGAVRRRAVGQAAAAGGCLRWQQ